jgi:von Willebrand factor type A domain
MYKNRQSTLSLQPLFRMVVIGLLLPMLFLSAPLTAGANGTADAGVDAVFVIDTSNSMNKTDPGKTAAEVMSMFIDMSEATRTRIGFVAYNDRIVQAQSPASMAEARNREQLKRTIQGLRYSGYSDLGLGLRRGAEMIEKAKDPARKPFLILLSDGGTDLRQNASGRSVAGSNKDVETAISKAKSQGYPIYTIGLNSDGSVQKDQLKKIAEATGGTSFVTQSTDDLPEIFNQIFAKHIQSQLVSVAAMTATGGLQEVTVTIPNSSMQEANIILLSNNPLLESQVYYQSQNVHFMKSKKYSLMKIEKPKKGNYLVKFRGKPGDLVKINLLGNYSLMAGVEVKPEPVIKGNPTTFTTYLHHLEGGKRLDDKDVYASMQAELIVTDLAGKKEEKVPMKNLGDSFTVDYAFPHTGKYEWRIFMNGPDFYRETATSVYDITNIAPVAASVNTLTIEKENGEQAIDLGSFFTDANNDKLTYTIITADPDERFVATIQDAALKLSPEKSGTSEITITATDAEGASVTGPLVITVHSVWDRYITIGMIVLLVAAIGYGVYLLTRPKPAFVGRLEGYFLHTASGNDIPVKFWPLASFGKKQRITLQELFTSLDVNEHLPEAQKIYFQPGKNQTLLLVNHSHCTVERGKETMPRHKKLVLQYNDKIYVTFEDRMTEIEIRFKKSTSEEAS